MYSCMLTAIEKEPKMFLDLSEESYHLIKLVSDNILLPTIYILIILKKIKIKWVLLHVGFISDGYNGKSTDVMLVQDCNYLECLSLNKAMMTSRGFKDLSCHLEAK